jgi:hypothetical protein
MAGWEELGIISNTSISFTYIYYLGSGPSYNGRSGDWYRLCWLSSMASSIHKVSAGGNFESQHKIGETLNKYFEDSNRMLLGIALSKPFRRLPTTPPPTTFQQFWNLKISWYPPTNFELFFHQIISTRLDHLINHNKDLIIECPRMNQKNRVEYLMNQNRNSIIDY